MSKEVYVCDKITMDIIRKYRTAYEAAKSENEPLSSVNMACRRRRVSRWGKTVFRFADDYDPNESFDGKQGRPVLVTDIATGKSKVFYTTQEAADVIFVSRDYIGNAAKNNWVVLKRYRLSYAR